MRLVIDKAAIFLGSTVAIFLLFKVYPAWTKNWGNSKFTQ